MDKKKNRQKGTKGITLIALIITIIVMLILVGVTINMAINGGLFTHAGKAVSDTQNEINKEQQLASGKVEIDGLWYKSIDDYINDNPSEENFVVVSEEITGANGDFKYVKLQNGEIQITRYIGNATEVTIPAVYDGFTVYSVGNIDAGTESFKRYNIFGETSSIENTKITKIAFEEGIKKIGLAAFNGCSKLNCELKLPRTLIEIAEWAFNCCSNLKGNLVIPDGVKKIGNGAFQGTYGYNNTTEGTLTLPNTLKEIGDYTFNECKGLTGLLVMPDSIIRIGKAAFQNCSGFTGKLVMPSKIVIIDIYAFAGCSGFSGDLKFPSMITEIGSKAFLDCSGLIGTITLPNTVTVGTDAFKGSGVKYTQTQ